VIDEPRRGYGSACLAGIAALDRPDVVVFLDGDFSDCPEEMDSLVDPILNDEADLVIGSRVLGRRERGALTPQSRCGNWLACTLIQLLWRQVFTDLGPFRAIRFNALQGLDMADRDYGWTVEMQVKAAQRKMSVREVPVRYRRRIGKSKISGTVSGAVRAGYKILWTIFRNAFSRPTRTTVPYDRLIVFGRYPVPGRTKTRLIPALGTLGAAQLHRRLAEAIVAAGRTLRDESDVELRVCFSDSTQRKMQQWLGSDLRYQRQCEGDLGRRMEQAFLDAFETGAERVVLIGTDVPGCTSDHLRRAFGALKTQDLVLGPTTDGGYWLIGLRRPVRLFDGIDWSTDRVLSQTLSAASDQRLGVFLLEPLADVDRGEDLPALPDALQPAKAVISVVIPALDEGENIERAVRSAQCDGAEVIVVDGGSTDDTVARASALGATVLSSERGRAGQMNLGARRAKGNILLFLHADCTLPPEYSRGVFEQLLDPNTVGGAHHLKSDAEGWPFALLDWGSNLRLRWTGIPYGDQAIFVRRGAFERLGGFPDVPIAEDLFFSRKLAKCGSVAVIRHEVTASARRFTKRGIVRQCAVNWLIALGCLTGVPLRWLTRLYG
jgi:rSAM/selenodomain-associated transferase 2/rSAM/selenodomain-associated transferase 1